MKELKMVADGRDWKKDTRIAMYLEKNIIVEGGVLVFYKEDFNKQLGEWGGAKRIAHASYGRLADDPSAVNNFIKTHYYGAGFADFRKAEERDLPKEEPKEEKDSQKDGNNKGRNEMEEEEYYNEMEYYKGMEEEYYKGMEEEYYKGMEEETNEDVKADINELNNIENTIKEYKEKAGILYKRIKEKRGNRAVLAEQAIKNNIRYLGYFGVTENRHNLSIYHHEAWDSIECLIWEFVVFMVKNTKLDNEENMIKYYIEKLNNMISRMADEILK